MSDHPLIVHDDGYDPEHISGRHLLRHPLTGKVQEVNFDEPLSCGQAEAAWRAIWQNYLDTHIVLDPPDLHQNFHVGWPNHLPVVGADEDGNTTSDRALQKDAEVLKAVYDEDIVGGG